MRRLAQRIPSGLAAVLVSLAGVPAGSAVPAPDPVGTDSILPGLMARGHVAGVSLALIRGWGVAETGTFGVRRMSTGEPVDDDTVFEAASLSKPLFAYLVLRLAGRGDVDLDAPLSGILPLARLEHDPRSGALTARMVLSHTTGLPNWGGDTLDLAFDPGTSFRYSGEGFLYLQRVLEERTGLSLDQLARREVFGPLGMDRSSFVWNPAFEDDHAHGHGIWSEDRPIMRFNDGNAAGSLITTAGDYARFLIAAARGTGLDPDLAAAMVSPRSPTVAPGDSLAARHVFWGLGWGLLGGDTGSTLLWHTGDNGAFKAYAAMDPSTGNGFVYLSNSVGGLAIVDSLASRLLCDVSWSLRWWGYEQQDDPLRQLRLGLADAFHQEGPETGVRAYGNAAAADPDLVTEAFTAELARLLLDEGDLREAAAVCSLNALRYPDSEDASRSLEWVTVRLAAAGSPPSPDARFLAAIAGDYGSRRFFVEDGVLFYRRDGREPRRLVPLTADTFALEGSETVRFRFPREATGEVGKVEVLYFDGSRTESPRNAGD